MDVIKKIELILEEPLKGHGYDIVRILLGGNYRKTLQIMIENQDERSITLEDCEKVSRLSSVLLDQHDPISEAYTLEISSPGMDRPLTKVKDYQKYTGREVVVKTYQAIENRKVFVGILESASEETITLVVKNDKGEEGTVSIPYGDIRSGKLYIRFD